MQLDFTGERVLAVVAHPDDTELLCAGTLTRAREDGAAVGVCILCRGDKGQPARKIAKLAEVRRREAKAAASHVDAELYFGDVADGTLEDGAVGRGKLIDVYRQFAPTLVLAHAPQDYHPDHRAASALAEAASWFAASRGQASRRRPLDRSPALWWMDAVNMSGFEPGFFVDVTGQLAIKEKMLACHKSQLSRGADSEFTPLFELMRRQVAARGAQAGVAAAEAFRQHLAFGRVRGW